MPANTNIDLFLASSNEGKLTEYRALACSFSGERVVNVEPLPGFEFLLPFNEDAPTFAENALGKALEFSRHHMGLVFADDSGLVVPSLGGAPGVHSARYAGENATNAQRIAKLLQEMTRQNSAQRNAFFVCAIALAERGKPKAIVTDRVEGSILETPQGTAGFGYDPVFYFPSLQKTFAELSGQEKNQHSHRGKAFRKLLAGLILR